MFQNIGKKLILTAKILFWVELVAVIIFTIVFIAEGYIYMTLLIGVGGPFFSWVSAAMIYSHGQLVDDTHKLAEGTTSQQLPKPKSHKDRVLKKWLDQGLITRDEYLSRRGEDDD